MHTTINVPRNPEAYLVVNYNKDCLKVVVPPNDSHTSLHGDTENKIEMGEFVRFMFTDIRHRFPQTFKLLTRTISRRYLKAFNHYTDHKSMSIDYQLDRIQLMKELPRCMFAMGRSNLKKSIMLKLLLRHGIQS